MKSCESLYPLRSRPWIAGRVGFYGIPAALLVGGVLWISAYAQPLGAEESASQGGNNFNEIHSQLISHLQEVAAGQDTGSSSQASPHNFTPIDREVLSALRTYVQQIGGDQAESGEPTPAPYHSVAVDDEAYHALREYVREIGGDPDPAADNRPIRLAEAAPRAAKAKAKVVVPVAEAEAHAVGSQVCMTCHAALAAKFANTVMGKIGKVRKGTMECENCHGPGSLHVKAGGGRGVGNMITFRADDPRHTVEENNAICLACHERGDRNLWRGSTHDTRGVACTNCHTVMTNVTPKFQLAKLTEQDTCYQCHKDKRAQMWRSGHMPVREGKMTCSSCHNPHGSFSDSLLKEATVNDTCYKCHAEKRGPFLFEHAPVRENCANCHDPHGSVNDFLLKMARPRICQQCHANLTGHPGNPRNPQSIFALNRECQNCHQQIHGSNSPAAPRFLR